MLRRVCVSKPEKQKWNNTQSIYSYEMNVPCNAHCLHVCRKHGCSTAGITSCSPQHSLVNWTNWTIEWVKEEERCTFKGCYSLYLVSADSQCNKDKWGEKHLFLEQSMTYMVPTPAHLQLSFTWYCEKPLITALLPQTSSAWFTSIFLQDNQAQVASILPEIRQKLCR